MTSPLADQIAARIRAGGPISIADYMAECLLHPDHGYYARREPFGADGDFITAPEISQLFGEIVGAWLIHVWRQAGQPDPFVLAEVGPGRGTLMADIVRTARIDGAFAASADVVLIEASQRLRAIQAATIGDQAPHTKWHHRIEDLPERPLFLVANEFLDALPIRQFVKTGDGWHERLVGLTDDEQLGFLAGPSRLPPDALPSDHEQAAPGAIFEIAPAREAAVSAIATHIARHGGVALFIDYGHTRTAVGDTLQAVRNHQYVDPLADPGLADVTSHVDFEALARAATHAGTTALAPMTQGDFLLANGIAERAGRLGARMDAGAQAAIVDDVGRLCGSGASQMGSLFKVLCIMDRQIPRPLAPFDIASQTG